MFGTFSPYIAASLGACEVACDKRYQECHGFVYVEDSAENDEDLRGLCSLKYGNVYVNGTHSQKTYAQLALWKYN